jgi:hypothetical protein
VSQFFLEISMKGLLEAVVAAMAVKAAQGTHTNMYYGAVDRVA